MESKAVSPELPSAWELRAEILKSDFLGSHPRSATKRSGDGRGRSLGLSGLVSPSAQGLPLEAAAVIRPAGLSSRFRKSLPRRGRSTALGSLASLLTSLRTEFIHSPPKSSSFIAPPSERGGYALRTLETAHASHPLPRAARPRSHGARRNRARLPPRRASQEPLPLSPLSAAPTRSSSRRGR